MIIKSAKISSVPKDYSGMVQSLLYPLEENRGHVFAIYSISGRRNAIREKVAIVINEHIDRFRQTVSPEANIPRRFEQMVQALNDRLADISQDFQQFPLKDLNAVVGVTTKEQVFLTGFGGLNVQYMHKTSKERYTIYDLGQQFLPTEDSSWDKVFISVLDGELHGDDIFYLGTQISQRELAYGELQDIISTLPPSGALKRIEQFIGAQVAYAGICFKFHIPKETKNTVKTNPISSLEHLGKTKDGTAQILGENNKEIFSTFKNAINNLSQNLHKPGERDFLSIVKKGFRLLLKAISVMTDFLGKALDFAKPHAKKLFTSLKEADLQTRTKESLHKIKRSILNIRNTSWKVRLSLLTILILIISSVFSLRSVRDQQMLQQELERFDLIENTIQEKKEQAEARIIFRDTDSARSLLTEALSLIDTLPDLRSEQGRVEQLRSEILSISSELQGIIVPETSVITTAPDNLIRLAVADNESIFAISSTNAYRFNSVNQSLELVNRGTLGQLQNIISLSNSALVLDEQRQLGRLNSNTVMPLISGTNRLNDIAAVYGYNESLYALTASAEQIIRMRPQGDNFEAGTPWIIARSTSLANARDMAIDGDIYVLLADRILQFRSGRELSFELKAVDPPLSQAMRIVTSIDMRNIYVLEPSRDRIIVLDKNGNFVNQYVFEGLDDINDMIINESRREGYVISGGQLIRFTLDHLLR